MKKRLTAIMAMIILLSVPGAFTQENETISLPDPQRSGGMPLFEALDRRQTIRDYKDQEIDMQTLSNLLWAAYGINRPDGKQTVPAARNWKKFDIYVVMADGWYMYELDNHSLIKKGSDDMREFAGRQDFVHTAPLTLIFVADYDRMPDAEDSIRDFYSATDVGFISQNVYLFCASEGLGTCVIGQVDREKMREMFKLRPRQQVILSQSIGYPK